MDMGLLFAAPGLPRAAGKRLGDAMLNKM